MRAFFLGIFIGLFSIPCVGQIGSWRTHFNYLNAKDLAIVNSHVYCASENGLFYVDKQAQEAVKLSKLDGFTENQIAKLAYNSDTKKLIIAYQTGMIDLVSLTSQDEPASIRPLTLLNDANSIVGSKAANHIAFKDGVAYLAYDFGLVVLDLNKQEIKETYQNLGENGAALPVYKTVFANDSIYLSTSIGIRVAPASATINLQYYGNWKTLFSNHINIAENNNKLYWMNGSGFLYAYSKGISTPLAQMSTNITSIEKGSDSNTFLLCTGQSSSVFSISNQSLSLLSSGNLRKPIKALQDSQGKIWIADKQTGLLSASTGTFQSFSPSSLDTLYSTRKDSIVTDEEGNKWIRQGLGQGIMVINPKNQVFYLYTGKGNGNLPSNTVKSMCLDKNGQLWVGTDKGVAVFDYPPSVFTGKNFDAYFPIFEKRRLLSTETITSIAIDGGNRKWIGTKNGIFLFSSDASELVSNFTVSNSPLPSNEITYITVEGNTGEVYIRTTKGMVSYRGTSTEAPTVQESVKVYPNPVKSDFSGLVAIEGLTENAYLKITDATGFLVYETRANGGTAVWNARTLSGNKVASGIYFIFSMNSKGEETLVNKIAVIQ